MPKEERKFECEYTPEILYFATYMAVSDRRLFFDEWKRLGEIIAEKGYGEDVYQNVIAIIRDLDGKVIFEDVINWISQESIKVKETALLLAFEIAYSDYTLDDVELELFNQVRTKWNIRKTRFEELRKNAIEKVEAIKNSFENSCFTNELFEQEKYKAVCKDMELIAKDDISYSMSVVNAAVKQLKAYPALIKKQVDSVVKSSFSFQESEQKKEMQGFLSQLTMTISQIIDEANGGLEGLQKKQNEISNHFTISFMGRTKAGKSTIHSILLGDINSDFIGKGMERTTRYNYIYDYNGIRIIDTPGIGAPNGQTDTEVAKEVADESDLICYVVTSDSIQETEFAFLEHLKGKNKPVLILLNKKENFVRSKKTKEKFLENPLNWYERTGEDAIQGHIDRITEYVQKKFNYHNYSIIPVQLLAAKMACLEENKEIKEKLLIGSRINEFIDTLFEMICDYGVLQKSQTIYNASLYYLGRNSEVYKQQSNMLKEVKDEFGKHGEICIEKIDVLTQKTRNEIIKSINTVLDCFVSQEVRRFAHEHYGSKKEELEKEWKQFLIDRNIEKQIRDKYEVIWNTYLQSLEEIICEVEENMEFSVEYGTLSGIRLGSVIDTKMAIDMTGRVIGLIGTIVTFANPLVGGVMIAVSIVMSIAGSRMKTKQKKIEEKQEKLYQTLKENMNNIRDNVLKDILKQYDTVSGEIGKNVRNSFALIDKSLGKVDENMLLLKNEQQTFIDKLNCRYAARIANYITVSPIYDFENDKTFSGLAVERIFGMKMTIRDDKLYIAERKNELEKVSKILQEMVVIDGGN